MKKIEVVKSYWKSESQKNLTEILSHFAENAKFSSPTMKLENRININVFYRKMIDDFSLIKVTPTHWIEQGDEIAVEYDCYLIKNSGEERFVKGFNLFKIKKQLIIDLRCYFNPSDF